MNKWWWTAQQWLKPRTEEQYSALRWCMCFLLIYEHVYFFILKGKRFITVFVWLQGNAEVTVLREENSGGGETWVELWVILTKSKSIRELELSKRGGWSRRTESQGLSLLADARQLSVSFFRAGEAACLAKWSFKWCPLELGDHNSPHPDDCRALRVRIPSLSIDFSTSELCFPNSLGLEKGRSTGKGSYQPSHWPPFLTIPHFLFILISLAFSSILLLLLPPAPSLVSPLIDITSEILWRWCRSGSKMTNNILSH